MIQSWYNSIQIFLVSHFAIFSKGSHHNRSFLFDFETTQYKNHFNANLVKIHSAVIEMLSISCFVLFLITSWNAKTKLDQLFYNLIMASENGSGARPKGRSISSGWPLRNLPTIDYKKISEGDFSFSEDEKDAAMFKKRKSVISLRS